MSNEDELETEEGQDEEAVFIPYDIFSYPSDLTLEVINNMWRDGDIRIPDFQRNFVWSIQQSSLLIDSFLRGLPVPQAFFYVEDDNTNLIIDGLQRIMSIVFFFDGYFGSEKHGKKQIFKLTGLGKNSPFQGKSFDDLDESQQRKLKTGSVLRAINIRQVKPTGEQTSKFHIFERLNTGGTPLKAQEIRNCVFTGDFVETLRRLNNDPNWRKIIGKAAFDKHQKDVELVLRVFAFSTKWQEYTKPMKEFLNLAMMQNRSGVTDRAKIFEERFSRTCALIVKTLGEKPFHIRKPLNTAALDSVFCTILDHEGKLVDDIKSQYDQMLLDKDYQEGTYYGTSDAENIEKRFKTAIRYLVR